MIVAGDMNDYDGMVLDSFRFEAHGLWLVFVVEGWGFWRLRFMVVGIVWMFRAHSRFEGQAAKFGV